MKFDEVGLYSATPEPLAKYIASHLAKLKKLQTDRPINIVDACCGIGANAIQFAAHGHCTAIEIDAGRLDLAKHNMWIYRRLHDITLVHADFLKADLYGPNGSRPDVIFFDPPWGG